MTNTQPNPDNVRDTVAHNLREALKAQRWSERNAATALGLNHTYINRRTTGDTELSASDLAMFANFLNMRVQDFFAQVTVRSLATVHQLHPATPTVERDTPATVTVLRAAR